MNIKTYSNGALNTGRNTVPPSHDDAFYTEEEDSGYRIHFICHGKVYHRLVKCTKAKAENICVELMLLDKYGGASTDATAQRIYDSLSIDYYKQQISELQAEVVALKKDKMEISMKSKMLDKENESPYVALALQDFVDSHSGLDSLCLREVWAHLQKHPSTLNRKQIKCKLKHIINRGLTHPASKSDLSDLGLEINHLDSRHLAVHVVGHPEVFVTVSRTPSDHRHVDNTVCEIMRRLF